MKTALIAASFIGLALTIVPSFLVFAEMMSRDTYAALMAVGTILWFATAPFWMKKDQV